jgi:menaquinone-dependent protoporphyrinogen oxidase
MLPRILVIYGTSYGQTGKIARRIAETLKFRGLETELCDAGNGAPRLAPDRYSAIVIGSSIIAGGHQTSIKQFVADNIAILNRQPSAFFQVSASAGSGSVEGRNAAQRILDEFVAKNHWTPTLCSSLAGAINYTQYNPFLRWYMKRAAAQHGGSTDTSRDHELTDWAQVDRFALTLAEELARSRIVIPEPARTA